MSEESKLLVFAHLRQVVEALRAAADDRRRPRGASLELRLWPDLRTPGRRPGSRPGQSEPAQPGRRPWQAATAGQPAAVLRGHPRRRSGRLGTPRHRGQTQGAGQQLAGVSVPAARWQ